MPHGKPGKELVGHFMVNLNEEDTRTLRELALSANKKPGQVAASIVRNALAHARTIKAATLHVPIGVPRC